MDNKFHKSNLLLERALKVSPLGAQTFSKSHRYYCCGYSPLFLERGEGCYVWDVDGNRYIDFVCALGPISIGYNNERVNQAVIKQLEKGVTFSQPVELSVELAEKLTQILPCAQMVRFLKNGSDATAAAVRLARAYTGKDIVLCSGYHGMHDWYICSTVNNAGIPQKVSEYTKHFKYNDIDDLKNMMQKHSGQIAAVIMEPIQKDGPEKGYLEQVKLITHENDAVLIFDEVVSGFRYALGGASELYGVVPDMAAYGKGIANGFPLSVLAGKRKILELIEEKAVFISTTFGGEALSITAALETIKILEQPGIYENLRRLGNILKGQLDKMIRNKGLAPMVKTCGISPHGGVMFSDAKDLDYLDLTSVYSQIMTDNGILTLNLVNLNTSHGDEEINKYVEAADLALTMISTAIERQSVSGILRGNKIDPVFRRN